MIRVARELAASENVPAERLSFEELDMTQVATLGGGFDGVLCNSVVEYLDQPESVVASLASSITPGGRLLISVPNRRSLLRKFLRLTYRISGWPAYLRLSKNHYTRDEFAGILERNQMCVEQAIIFGGPLPRWMQRSPIVGSLCMFVARKVA